MAVPSPNPNIDWKNLPADRLLTLNGHIECRYRHSTGKWTDPVLVENPHLSIHGLAPGLNYGQQAFEGMKAFRQAATEDRAERIVIFRPDYYANRIQRSAGSIVLPSPPPELFKECVRRAVAANADFIPPASDEKGFLYIRPLVFGSGPGLFGPGDEVMFVVYVHPASPLNGIKAITGAVTDEFDRAAPRGMGAFKVGGNYAPVWKHTAKAKKLGFDILLHLDAATHTLVEEFSTSAFLGHKLAADGSHILVIPDTENAIASTAGNSFQALARREGWTIEKTLFPFSSVGELDEVVAVGTAAAGVPINSLERPTTGEKFTFKQNLPEWNLLKLAQMLNAIQRGHAKDTEDWCEEITGFPAPKPKAVAFKEQETPVATSTAVAPSGWASLLPTHFASFLVQRIWG